MKTERLLIRRFAPDDWQDLYEYLSQEETVKYEPYEVFTKEASKQEAVRRSNNNSFWAVCLNDSGKLIGNLYLSKQDFDTWELGYVFNQHYQGNGYATEAALRMLQYGFEECMAHRIVAHCNLQNTASWRLLERLFMRREGHFLQKAFFKYDAQGQPVWHDAFGYAMLSSEWQERAK